MLRRTLLLTPAALALSACGFQLRQAPNFAFSEIYVGMPEQSTLGNELKRQIAASGKVELITDPKKVADAQVVFESLVDQREKVVVGLNAAGQVREFQLRLRFKFRLRGREGKPLIADTEILQQRDISFNESAVLAKEAEEALLYRDMQSDIVQQILRRLAAVKEL
ncbi:MAG TPA: LPS assembly lipoprotein LptE [Burkholderiaceae bacterium]|nr:LPS assembly lipoprotein LptE [Burkholderiaceae bacterium]